MKLFSTSFSQILRNLSVDLLFRIQLRLESPDELDLIQGLVRKVVHADEVVDFDHDHRRRFLFEVFAEL